MVSLHERYTQYTKWEHPPPTVATGITIYCYCKLHGAKHTISNQPVLAAFIDKGEETTAHPRVLTHECSRRHAAHVAGIPPALHNNVG